MKYELISLQDLINSTPEQSVKNILKKFSCHRNKDVENFFCNKSIQYMNLNLARTFIYFNREKLEKGDIEIAAYFAIGQKHLEFGPDVSKNRKKKLCKSLRKDAVICYLIGQIGKNDDADNDDLQLNDILKDIYIRFSGVIDAIGGQLILIECYEDKLIEYYTKHGFTYLQKVKDSNGKDMNQLVKKVSDIRIVDEDLQESYTVKGKHKINNVGIKHIAQKRHKSGYDSKAN